MNLLERFKFYGLGFLIGILFLVLVFGKRNSCSSYIQEYMPNGRVLSEVKSKPITYSDSAIIQMEQLQIDTAFVKHKILTEGEINFNQSEPRKKPCSIYHIYYTDSTQRDLCVNFEKCKEAVLIQKIEKIK